MESMNGGNTASADAEFRVPSAAPTLTHERSGGPSTPRSEESSSTNAVANAPSPPGRWAEPRDLPPVVPPHKPSLYPSVLAAALEEAPFESNPSIVGNLSREASASHDVLTPENSSDHRHFDVQNSPTRIVVTPRTAAAAASAVGRAKRAAEAAEAQDEFSRANGAGCGTTSERRMSSSSSFAAFDSELAPMHGFLDLRRGSSGRLAASQSTTVLPTVGAAPALASPPGRSVGLAVGSVDDWAVNDKRFTSC